MKKYLTYRDVEGKIKIIATDPVDPMDYIDNPKEIIAELRRSKVPPPSSPILVLIDCQTKK